jgi:hypothetical protein
MGAVGYFIATIVAMIPQSVTIAIDGQTVTPSFGPPIRMRDRPELSSWVVAGIDAAMGLAVTIGERGQLRIGGNGHDGEGYELRGAPVRTVDCHLDKQQIEALLAALGIARGKAGPLAVPLVRNSQSFGHVVRSMLPWALTIAGFGVLAGILGDTEAGDRFSRSPEGRLAISLACGAIALISVVYMVIRVRRVKMPALELRFSDDALIVVTRRNGVERRVPWSRVAIEKLQHSVTSRVGTFTMPILVLDLGDGKPLRIGAWDTALAWPGEPAKSWRGPTWLVGAAKWPRFLAEMKRHGRG